MNRKGFTLVELLAVIVILSLLALITTTSVSNLVLDAKEDLSDTQMQLIQSAAETWGAENLSLLPDQGECGYLTLKDLKNYGVMDSKVLDPKNNQEISDELQIKVITTTTSYGNPKTNFEVNPKSIDGCTQIYYPICTIASDSTITGLELGAKYNCDPGDGIRRIFYVLENGNTTTLTNGRIAESNEVTLIMNENIINTYTIWGNIGDTTPTVALTALEGQTSGWKNVDLYLPTKEQLMQASGTSNEYGTLATWLQGNYWTSTAYNSNFAYTVMGTSMSGSIPLNQAASYIRPVITVPVYNIKY